MNGTAETELPTDFKWSPEYEQILISLASSNYFQQDWNELRNMIKFKLKQNITSFLSDPPPSPPPEVSTVPPEAPSASPESASTVTTVPPGVISTTGAKFPPFPKREEDQFIRNEFNSYGRSKMVLTEEEAKEMYAGICKLLYEFEGDPPFTIQRICELMVRPRQHFKYSGKYLRAVERALLVTSTIDAFPVIKAEDTASASSSPFMSTIGSLREATTPLFSPIPFLHEDARRSGSRSRSRSPPMSPLSLASAASGAGSAANVEPLSLGVAAGTGIATPVIGLVDELDDPGPGHLSDHPTALSSTTTTTASGSNTTTGTRTGATTATTKGGASGANNTGTTAAQASANTTATTPKPMFGGSLQERFVKGTTLAASEAEMEVEVVPSSSAPTSVSSDQTDAGAGAAEPSSSSGSNGASEAKTGAEVESVGRESMSVTVDEPDADKENVPKTS